MPVFSRPFPPSTASVALLLPPSLPQPPPPPATARPRAVTPGPPLIPKTPAPPAPPPLPDPSALPTFLKLVHPDGEFEPTCPAVPPFALPPPDPPVPPFILLFPPPPPPPSATTLPNVVEPPPPPKFEVPEQHAHALPASAAVDPVGAPDVPPVPIETVTDCPGVRLVPEIFVIVPEEFVALAPETKTSPAPPPPPKEPNPPPPPPPTTNTSAEVTPDGTVQLQAAALVKVNVV